MKIWARTVSEEKITRNILYNTDNFSDLTSSLQEICEQLDIPTPILTQTSEGYFFDFNVVKFRPSDFVETVDFDFFEIENV